MAQRRFHGLTLAKGDAGRLKRVQSTAVGARLHKRIFVLELLNQGNTIQQAATAVSMYPKAVRRIARAYMDVGLDAALYDKPRRKEAPELDARQRQSIVALACTPAPEGRSRWTVRLLAIEAVARGVVPKAGREMIRLILAEHDLKPWREKNVVRSRSR